VILAKSYRSLNNVQTSQFDTDSRLTLNSSKIALSSSIVAETNVPQHRVTSTKVDALARCLFDSTFNVSRVKWLSYRCNEFQAAKLYKHVASSIETCLFDRHVARVSCGRASNCIDITPIKVALFDLTIFIGLSLLQYLSMSRHIGPLGSFPATLAKIDVC
jgi:hypothetical protein